ncbi:MAG: hypothetical protein LBE09_07375 [Christensenellaceae bacterium]|jgi:hypothetical protein|nr:hypothetical protein [Christensenellaceae bacterium]
MNLNDFENFVNDSVLERGRKYKKQGKVAELSCDNNVYSALVEGTECYNVTIQVDNANQIVEHNCTCPYNMTNICKHEVAVLYAIRDGLDEPRATKAKKPRTSSKEKPTKEQSIKDAIAYLSRQELEEILLRRAENDKTLLDEIIYSSALTTGNIKAAKKFIMSFVRRAKRDGVIRYGHVGDALEGADIIISKAQCLASSGELVTALDLFLLIIGIVVEMAGYSDDDGDICERLSACFAGITEIVSIITAQLDKDLWIVCFNKIVGEAKSPVYEGWDTSLDLLGCCYPFCVEKEFADKLLNILDDTLKGDTKPIPSDDIKYINGMKHSILAILDDTQAEKFEEAHISDPQFRSKVIERCITKCDYETALKMCEDLKFNQACDFILRIYKATGETRKYQTTLLKAVCTYKLFPYFYDLKDSYTGDEWFNVLPTVLNKIEDAGISVTKEYHELLIKNRCFDRLLKYCTKQPALIINYYKDLKCDYPNEVKAIFEKYLSYKFSEASGFSAYEDCCHLMRTFKKACGGESMRELRDKLLSRYPNKRALVAQLSNLD